MRKIALLLILVCFFLSAGGNSFSEKVISLCDEMVPIPYDPPESILPLEKEYFSTLCAWGVPDSLSKDC